MRLSLMDGTSCGKKIVLSGWKLKLKKLRWGNIQCAGDGKDGADSGVDMPVFNAVYLAAGKPRLNSQLPLCIVFGNAGFFKLNGKQRNPLTVEYERSVVFLFPLLFHMGKLLTGKKTTTAQMLSNEFFCITFAALGLRSGFQNLLDGYKNVSESR
jgi:hypothetical protein